jgi:penicillin-binding protein 2
MLDAITQSCNVFFFTAANKIGIAKIDEMAKNFGYGEKFDVSLYGTKSGNMPSEEWKQTVFKQVWTGGDTLNTAIGQGFVLATPLQMAVIAARIANGGVPITPYLVKNRNITEQFESLQKQPLIKNIANLNIVKEGMRRVVNDPMGTAYLRRIDVSGFEMAGKSGTSQVISKRESEMSRSESMINANQNHAIFVAFAPISDPKYAISVVVEHGKSGSGAAAPIARDILLEAQTQNHS